MKPTCGLLAVVLLGCVMPVHGEGPAGPVSRPTKEPKYQSDPRYALAVFGPKAETRAKKYTARRRKSTGVARK